MHEPTLWHTNSDFCGLRTPTFTRNEMFMFIGLFLARSEVPRATMKRLSLLNGSFVIQWEYRSLGGATESYQVKILGGGESVIGRGAPSKAAQMW